MVQILMFVHTMKISNFGSIFLDDSKFKTNASIHCALYYWRIQKPEAQLKGEVKKLMELAETANN